jgi:LacI family transcriptional regulator
LKIFGINVSFYGREVPELSKRATANEVAYLAGVSKWTVIRAFTPGASITEASRRKVLAAAEKLHYSPNLLARSLATNLTHQVAILVDDFANPHKLPFLERLTALLQAGGRVASLININTANDHFSAMMHAEQRQVDAIIVFGTSFEDGTLRDRRFTKSFPDLYVLARDSQTDMMTSVNCDTERAMREICGHLADGGYRSPCFMSGPETISTALGRRRYFMEFWAEKLGHPIPEIRAERYSATSGGDTIRAYLREKPVIDLIMCENDILACGAKDVIAHEFGIRVPQDIAIVGFDNLEMSGARPYSLTTYEQPMDEMAGALVDMILGRRPKAPVTFPGTLIVRQSTR